MSRALETMSKKEFRPRPIDVNQPLPIISDEKILDEIEKDTISTKKDVKGKHPKQKQQQQQQQQLQAAVATPLYREIPDKITGRFSRPQAYIVYQESEETQSDSELEYELDFADEQFLAALNLRIKARYSNSRQLRSRSTAPKPTKREKISATTDITDDMLEQLIDGLEKEAFYKYGLRHMRDNTMDGMLCSVCNDHDADEGNALVLCDMCNMATHQHCYGIHEMPVATWMCARCVRRESTAVCVLCGGRYGAMKPTLEGQWVHVICALWFPEISCKDELMCEPILGIETIRSDKFSKVCSLCNDSRGVCITCDEEGCKTQFHVGCARARGLFLEARPDEKDENNIVLTAYCPVHSLHHLEHYPAFPRDLERSLGNETALVAKSMGLAEEDYNIIYSYWRVKRRSHPPPLLKRLRGTSEGHTAGSSSSTSSIRRALRLAADEEHMRFVSLRQDFERARMLVDLVRKRELAKRQLLDSLHSLILFHTKDYEVENSASEEEEEQQEDNTKKKDQKRPRHRA